MRRRGAYPVLFGWTAVLMLTVAGTALGDTQKIKGLIVGRDGPNMIIKQGEGGGNVTVALDDNTKVQAVKGKLGLRRSDMGFAALIPGLPVDVEAEFSYGHLLAKTVKFKASALKTANMIHAGLTPTQQDLAAAKEDIETNKQGIEANQQGVQANKDAIEKTQAEQEELARRFGQLGEYDVKGTATVLFAVNSSAITDKAKQDLRALADQAKQTKGYLVHIAGYTDSSGNADYNQQLSDRRAAAVTSYLQKACGIPLYRVLAPDAMGESSPAATNETTQGMAQNRRVEVKILVNKGMAGT
jgi:outer membrane protein OmpA-like peptidoglycan-associated protein